MDTPPLTARQARFVEEFLVDHNGTQAAIRAGYSRKTAQQMGSENLSKPVVAAAVKARQTELFAQLHVTQETAIRDLVDIAKADPSELVDVSYTCCRHCWGKRHHWQWTEMEVADATMYYRADYEGFLKLVMLGIKPARLMPDARKEGRLVLDLRGGTGFNAVRKPHEGCPGCHGAGLLRTRIMPTSEWSPRARKLFAGIKMTACGPELKLRDQDGAALNLARHLGVFAKDNHLTISDGVKGWIEFGDIAGTKELPTSGSPEGDDRGDESVRDRGGAGQGRENSGNP